MKVIVGVSKKDQKLLQVLQSWHQCDLYSEWKTFSWHLVSYFLTCKGTHNYSLFILTNIGILSRNLILWKRCFYFLVTITDIIWFFNWSFAGFRSFGALFLLNPLKLLSIWVHHNLTMPTLYKKNRNSWTAPDHGRCSSDYLDIPGAGTIHAVHK